jgi:tetratricopeptide (TPR) repeat protein
MMHMKTYKSWMILLGLICLTQTACKKDFLDTPPQGQLTEALFPQSANDAFLATNAMYAQIRKWNFHSGGYPILDIMSDEARKGSNPGDGGRLTLFDEFSFTATASDIFPWYSATYQAIKSTNVVIEHVPEIEMDESAKSRYIGEAKFLRAFCYFNLVRAFGGVPKVTTVHSDYSLSRSPASEIYNEIIVPDLLDAINRLPEKSNYAMSDLGRASRGAAKALLAKVYLYLGNYNQAATYALEVINSGQYDLELNFSDAFSINGQNGVESIFELGAIGIENFENGGNQFANTQGVRGIPNKGWGFNRPSMKLINAYEANDVRKDATVIFLGETLDGVLIQGDLNTPDVTLASNGVDTLEIECYNQKVWTPGSTTIEQWGYNIRYIRFADVLLIAAEALNELGQSGTALTHLNRVRDRAGVEDITTTDQSDLRNLILNERMLELALEGNRFYDLVRTDKAQEVLGPLGFITGKHELLPLPQSEIDLSGGVLTQNPGW